MASDLLTPTHCFISPCLIGSVEDKCSGDKLGPTQYSYKNFQELTSLMGTLELRVLPHHGTETPASVFLAWYSRPIFILKTIVDILY